MNTIEIRKEIAVMPYFEYERKRIFYRDEGHGDVMLLLPGNTASSASHDGEVAFFAKSFRVICPDYPGYGKSDRVVRFPVDFWRNNAEMCMALLRSLGIDEFIAVGTSGGGIIALNTGIIAGESARCIVADSIPGEFPSAEEIQEWVNARELKTEEQIISWEKAHGEDWADIIKQDSALLLAAAGRNPYNGELGKIIAPVLLTASLADDLIADIGKKVCDIAYKIPLAKTVFFSAGRHPLMWSKPDEFRQEVLRFIEDNVSEVQRKQGQWYIL